MLRIALFSLSALALAVPAAPAAGKSTQAAEAPAPSEVLGFEPGDDYQLALWEELTPYYEQLAAASDRVELRQIGETVLGKPLIVLFVSSAENLADLDRHRETSAALARAEISEEEARRLSRDGKAVVWIDAGLHATEVAPAQMMPLLAHRVATEESEEMRRIRERVVLILMPCMNPDGLDIVASWYRRNLKTPFETTRPPELYHHYVGHDNNRDWFMNNMPESAAVSRVLYREWFPQIVYNHHQTGPAWARIFLPPFADPVNPNIHPGVTTGVNLVGSGDGESLRHEEDARRRLRHDLLDVVERRHAHRALLSQHDRHPHRDLSRVSDASLLRPREEAAPSSSGTRAAATQAAPTNGTDIFYPLPVGRGRVALHRDAVDYTFTASIGGPRYGRPPPRKVAHSTSTGWDRDAIDGGVRKEDRFAYVVPADQWDPGEAAALVDVLFIGRRRDRSRRERVVRGRRRELRSGLLHHFRARRRSAPTRIDLLEPAGLPRPALHTRRSARPSLRPRGLDAADADGGPGGSCREPVRPRPSASIWRESGPIRPEPATGRGQGRRGLSATPSHTGRTPRDESAAEPAARRRRVEVSWAAKEGPASADAVGRAGTLLVESDADREPTSRRFGAKSSGSTLSRRSSRGPRRRISYPLSPSRVGLYKSWVASMDEGWTRWLLEDYEFDLETITDDDVRSGDLVPFRCHRAAAPEAPEVDLLHGHAARHDAGRVHRRDRPRGIAGAPSVRRRGGHAGRARWRQRLRHRAVRSAA